MAAFRSVKVKGSREGIDEVEDIGTRDEFREERKERMAAAASKGAAIGARHTGGKGSGDGA